MKKVYKYIIASVALLFAAFTFGPAAFAQVEYDKKVSGPDANGVYTISLEAYVTGNVTVTQESIPADIVLVLDVSSSMTQSSYGDYSTRLAALRAAVAEFVDVIDKNDTENAPEGSDRLGNQIAIVPFGGSLATTGNLVPLGLTPLSNLSTITTKVNNLTSTIQKTNPAVGLAKALEYLNGVKNRESTKTVVLFTDGCPASEGPTTFDAFYAYNAVNTAYEIKNADYSPTIFTIGLFTDLGNNETQVMNYMNYASSNYPKAQATDYSTRTSPQSVTYSPGDGTYGGDYFQMAGDNDLSAIFKAIAEASGGSSMPAASASSVMVDIVTNSFSIPANADLGKVKVYKDTCTQASKDADISFSPTKVEITGQVTLKTNTSTGEVSVEGFDYGANWCGWDESANGNTGGPHGNKLVLEIPITINDDAVGGPAVETNASGSQLVLKDKDGNPIGEPYVFKSPTLKIPVSIWIQKQGLVGDDSAVFTLRRAPFAENFDPDKATWETFTKIVVNEKNMVTVTDDAGNTVKVVKISGLDPDYYYKIEEDAWGFGYTYQNKGIQYTVGDNLKNPFVFVNTPKDVKKAEAVVRNVFETRTTEIE